MAVKIVTDVNWQDTILLDKLVVVHFKADWCGPCRMIKPVLEKLSNEKGDSIIFGSMDVDENHDIPNKYNVRTIPTTLFFHNGEKLGELLGTFPKSKIERMIESHLDLY